MKGASSLTWNGCEQETGGSLIVQGGSHPVHPTDAKPKRTKHMLRVHHSQNQTRELFQKLLRSMTSSKIKELKWKGLLMLKR